jgi:hypothetical protein
VAGPDQVHGHRTTHVAEADEADAHGRVLHPAPARPAIAGRRGVAGRILAAPTGRRCRCAAQRVGLRGLQPAWRDALGGGSAT